MEGLVFDLTPLVFDRRLLAFFEDEGGGEGEESRIDIAVFGVVLGCVRRGVPVVFAVVSKLLRPFSERD